MVGLGLVAIAPGPDNLKRMATILGVDSGGAPDRSV